MMSIKYLRGLGRLVASKPHVATIQIPIGYKGCSSGQHSRSSRQQRAPVWNDSFRNARSRDIRVLWPLLSCPFARPVAKSREQSKLLDPACVGPSSKKDLE